MNFDLHNRKQEKGNACESAVHATQKMRIKNRMARTTRFFCLELERMCGSNFLRLQKLAQIVGYGGTFGHALYTGAELVQVETAAGESFG